MKIIIHFGQPRTGSTSLQYYLSNNSIDKLYYPLSPKLFSNVDKNNHHLLSICSLDDERYNPPKFRFLKEGGDIKKLRDTTREFVIDTYHKAKQDEKEIILFSSEDLYFLNNESEFLRLLELFEGIDVEKESICCFREKNSFKQSWINRLLYNNYTLTDDVDDFRCVDNNSSIFDYDKKKNLMSSFFDNALFFNYTENNIRNFLKKIGVEILGKELKYNQSKNYIKR